MTAPQEIELLSSKELAAKLKRHVSYVYAMKSAGFRMVAGRTTLAVALAWLVKHPQPHAAARSSQIHAKA